MSPHSGAFVLLLSLTLFDSLQTVSLNRDEGNPARTLTVPAEDPTGHVQPAASSVWTTQTYRVKMDTGTPPATKSLFTELVVNTKEKSNVLKDVGGAVTLAPDSFTIDTKTPNVFPVTQGMERISVTKRSATYDGDTGLSSVATSLAASLQADDQAWDITSPPAEQTDANVFQMFTSRTRIQTRSSTDWEQEEPKATLKRLGEEFLHDAGLGQEERDLLTTVMDNGNHPREFTKKPFQEMMSLTNTPRVSLKMSESLPNWTRPGLNRMHRDDAPYEEEDGLGSLEEERNMEQPARVTHATAAPARSPGSFVHGEWPDNDLIESSSQPDCNLDTAGVCNSSDALWNPGLPDNNLSSPLASPPPPPMSPPSDMTPPPMALTPPLLVPLLTDWNAAMATWGLAWELQVYGLGCVFSLVAVLSALSLLCLPLRWPSGCAHFSLLHLLQLLTGSSRALWLFFDPYGQRERLPLAWARLLHEAAYPCLSAAFGLLLLLLWSRSRTQLLSQNTLQRCSCLLAALVLLHVAVVMGSMAILHLFPALPVVPLLPPSAFLLLSFLLSSSYLLFYCCARTNAKHIYRLSENSPDHPVCLTDRCPLAEAVVWERAAATGLFSALFLLACAGLRLYAMLHVVGVTDGGRVGLMPWPWWGFQLSCRACEAGMCLTVALVVTHPLLCCGVTLPKLGHWRSLFHRSSVGGGATVKPPILPSGWSKRPGEKLGLREGMARHESESMPLYTLAEVPLGETDGLDLHYPSSPQHPPPNQPAGIPNKPSERSLTSLASLNCDSTADLRPPSPIDLRRSIDEALNSDALFQHSLFSSSRLSLSTRGPPDGQPCRVTSAEPALYRTASCGDADFPSVPSPPPMRSSATWRSSNSTSLCGGRRGHGGQAAHHSGIGSGRQSQSSLPRVVHSGHSTHKQYTVLGSSSSRESLCGKDHIYAQVDEQAVQAEFVNVCRQIDALSVSSDTIEL